LFYPSQKNKVKNFARLDKKKCFGALTSDVICTRRGLLVVLFYQKNFKKIRWVELKSYVLWNKNMMQEFILVRNSLFLIFCKIWHEKRYEKKQKLAFNHEYLSLGGKTNFGKTLRPKVFQKIFYHQWTNIHDFIPIFVFVTVSVLHFVTNFVPVFVKNQKQ